MKLFKVLYIIFVLLLSVLAFFVGRGMAGWESIVLTRDVCVAGCPEQSEDDIELAALDDFFGAGGMSKLGGVDVAAGGDSCPTDESLQVDAAVDTGLFVNILDNDDAVFAGQGDYDPGGTGITVCAVSFWIRTINATAQTLQVEIWEMNGTALGNAPTGTCTSTSQLAESLGNIKFVGLDCTLNNGTNYGIVLTRSDHSYDGTNYYGIYRDSSVSWSGTFREWKGNKTEGTDRTTEGCIDVYGYTN